MTGRDAALRRANDIGFSLLFVPCSKGAALTAARTNVAKNVRVQFPTPDSHVRGQPWPPFSLVSYPVPFTAIHMSTCQNLKLRNMFGLCMTGKLSC